MAGEIWIPIGISACSVIIAFIAFWKAKPAVPQSNSVFECFKILSDPKIKKAKEKLTEDWCSKQDQSRVIFSNDLTYQARRVRDAYESACAMYNLGMIDKELFRQVYGDIVVSTYRLMKDELDHLRSTTQNQTLCKNFENVSVELITDYGINANPYCPPVSTKTKDVGDMSGGVKLTGPHH